MKHLISLKACRWWSSGLVVGSLLCAVTPGTFAADATPNTTQASTPQASQTASAEETSVPAFDVAAASPEQVYNHAVDLYRQGDRAQAAELWSRVVARAPRDVEARARFNLGNCSYSHAVDAAEQDVAGALGHLDTAVSHYREALAVAPDDHDARANLELALRLKEQLRQQQEQEQQEQQQQDQQSQQDQQDQQQQQGGESSEQQQQNGEQNPQEQEKQQGDQQSSQEQDPSQEGESSDSEQPSEGPPSESQSDSPTEEGEQPQENEPPSAGQQNEQDSQESQNEQNQQPSSGSSGDPQEHEQEQQPAEESQNESTTEEQAQHGQPGDETDEDAQRQPPSAGTSRSKPSASETGQDDASKTDAGEPGDEQDPQDQKLPEGKLSAAGQDANREATVARNDQVEGTAEADGEMSKQEAEKLLQAVRDRDLLRRYEQLRREQARQRPVDRDW